jgi:hypothetical protein
MRFEMNQGYASKVDELSRRVVAINTKLNTLVSRKQALAPMALDSEKAALKELERIDAEEATLVRERELTSLAAAEARRLQAEQQFEAAQEQQNRRVADARKAADAVLALDQEIDDALIKLRELFERRKCCVDSLKASGIAPGYAVNRLYHKLGPTCAAHKAGLRDYFSIELVGPQQVATLVSVDHWLERPLISDNGSGVQEVELEKE